MFPVIKLHGHEYFLSSNMLISVGTLAAGTCHMLGTWNQTSMAEAQVKPLDLKGVVSKLIDLKGKKICF